MGYVYIIEFDQHIGNKDNPRGTAKYYVGYTSKSIRKRFQRHAKGHGAKICAWAVQAGIAFRVIVSIKATQGLERAIKDRKSTPKLINQIIQNNCNMLPNARLWRNSRKGWRSGDYR